MSQEPRTTCFMGTEGVYRRCILSSPMEAAPMISEPTLSMFLSFSGWFSCQKSKVVSNAHWTVSLIGSDSCPCRLLFLAIHKDHNPRKITAATLCENKAGSIKSQAKLRGARWDFYIGDQLCITPEWPHHCIFQQIKTCLIDSSSPQTSMKNRNGELLPRDRFSHAVDFQRSAGCPSLPFRGSKNSWAKDNSPILVQERSSRPPAAESETVTRVFNFGITKISVSTKIIEFYEIWLKYRWHFL